MLDAKLFAFGMRSTVIYIVGALCFLLLLSQAAKVDDSSASFLKTFEKFAAQKSGPHEWLSDKSPWAPYLTRPFYKSLNEDQQRIYLRYQTGPYHCDEIADFDLIGFLRAHPSMRQVMKVPKVTENFLTYIARPLSPGVIRCESLRLLYPIVRRNKSDKPIYRLHADIVEKMPPLNVVVLTQRGKPRGWASQQSDAYMRARRARGLETLMVLAIRYEYPPALSDLTQLILDGRHLQLPADLEYYLLTLSENLGGATDASLERATYLEGLLSDERQREVSLAAYAGNITQANIKGWYCRGPRARKKIAGNLLCTETFENARP